MVFKNEAELETFLLKKCQQALLKSQEQVYQIVQRFLDMYYTDYTPSNSAFGYDRTYQLLNSLVKSRVIPDGKGYKAEVYFDLDSLRYSKPAWQKGNNPSGEQVFEAAKRGLHGAIGDAGGRYQFNYVPGDTGANIWGDPIRVLDARAIEILKKMLISEGIPIK